MTSERPGTYVFTRLPATGEVVVAGRYELEMTSAGSVGHFIYGRSYLAREEAIALDPVHMPLQAEAMRTTLNGGLFGALRDVVPDFWGRMVIDRTHQPRNELDYLLATSDARVGALSFGPTTTPPPMDEAPGTPLAKLERAAATAEALESHIVGEGEAWDLDPALLDPSSGMGGARPKTVVADDDGQLWVAKFPSRHDRWPNAIAEGAYLRLAERCGIRAAASRLLELDDRLILLVRRFDQAPGGIRKPFLSAHTLLGLSESVLDRSRWSYIELAHLLRRISVQPEQDARELYRRIVFNALTSNMDDHPRNHAVICEDRGWRLSPAFDLSPSPSRSQDERLLAMDVGVLSNVEPRWANRANLVSGAEHFGFTAAEADALVSVMKELVVAEWQEAILSVGQRPVVVEQLAHAFPESYPGFEYPAGGTTRGEVG
jgi:serine/threonine-protein kinase HipA